MGKFCDQCGKELVEGAAFCTECGAPVSNFNKVDKEEKAAGSNKQKWIIVASACGAALILMLAGAGTFLYLNSNSYQCKKNMKLAEKKYEAGEYEEALTYYQAALERDDTVVDAYLKSADIYLAEESYDEAIAILKDGITKNIEGENSKNLEDKLAELCMERSDYFLAQGEYEQAVGILTEGTGCTDATDLAEREAYLRENIIVRREKEIECDDDDNIVEWNEAIYDNTGNMIKYECYDSDGNVEWGMEYEYDASGNETKYVYYESGKISEWEENEYNEFGSMIKSESYDANGNMYIYGEAEYDNEGNVAQFIYYYSDGSKGNWSEYEYDKNGNMTKHLRYFQGDYLKFVTEYNEAGSVSKFVFYNDDESVREWIEYDYDENENLVKSIGYNSDGSISGVTEYDEAGNRIKNLSYDEEGNITEREEAEYDEEGHAKEYIAYNSDGSVSSVIEYDQWGNEIKYTEYDDKGNPDEQWEKSYDSLGNILSDSEDGNYVYEYTYAFLGDERDEELEDILEYIALTEEIKQNTVEKYYSDPWVRAAYEEQIRAAEGLGLSISIEAKGNDFIMSYKYSEDMVLPDDAGEQLEAALEEAAFIFEMQAAEIDEEIGRPGACTIIIRYLDSNDNVLAEKAFKAE